MDTNHGLEAPAESLPIPALSDVAETTQSPAIPATLPVVEVRDLDWQVIREAVDAQALRARVRDVVERMETLLDSVGGPGMLFDNDRAHAADRAIRVSAMDDASPLWIIGDLHGDLLALESALAQIRRLAPPPSASPRIIFLGDFIDDEGFGLEVLLRVFELIVEARARRPRTNAFNCTRARHPHTNELSCTRARIDRCVGQS